MSLWQFIVTMWSEEENAQALRSGDIPVTQATRGQPESVLASITLLYSIAYVKMNMTVIFSLFPPSPLSSILKSCQLQ